MRNLVVVGEIGTARFEFDTLFVGRAQVEVLWHAALTLEIVDAPVGSVWPEPSLRLAEVADTFVVKLRLPEPPTVKAAADVAEPLSAAQLPVMVWVLVAPIATVQAAVSDVKVPKDRSDVLVRVMGATTVAVTFAVSVSVVLLFAAAWLSPAANNTVLNATIAEN